MGQLYELGHFFSDDLPERFQHGLCLFPVRANNYNTILWFLFRESTVIMVLIKQAKAKRSMWSHSYRWSILWVVGASYALKFVEKKEKQQDFFIACKTLETNYLIGSRDSIKTRFFYQKRY